MRHAEKYPYNDMPVSGRREKTIIRKVGVGPSLYSALCWQSMVHSTCQMSAVRSRQAGRLPAVGQQAQCASSAMFPCSMVSFSCCKQCWVLIKSCSSAIAALSVR